MLEQSIAVQGQETAKQIIEQNQSLLEGCCLIGSHIRSSSGERTLPNAQVQVDGQHVSSNHVKGSKIQWFPRKKLSITSKYTQRLSRLFSSVGVRYGDMTIVPKEKLDELQPKIEEIKQNWEEDVNDLVNNFDAIMQDYIDDNPNIAELIKKYALDKEAFHRSFQLTYLKPLAIQPLFEDDVKEMESTVALTLWEEVAKEGQNIYKTSWFKDKRPVNRVSQAVRNPLKRLMNKMLSLGFLDEGVKEITRTFREVFKQLPSNGYIEGHDFQQLTDFIHVVSDINKLRLHAEGASQFQYEAPVEEVEIESVEAVNQELPVESNQVTSAPVIQTPPIVKPKVESSQLGFGIGF
ncbi:DUF3150 domain-containing protein [Thalassotalea piscium]|uniref:DUF3150 domain-containing protein n=1 Tax=Thalassotalea piscium TaxID=1230533 RepID=A0A7X0TTH1_9GAMM|nr:DUF3150 domain-containing protein [Thalassotalea piscium]MBB6543119.1 hypothetical protein [Thalassotalea piscium]